MQDDKEILLQQLFDSDKHLEQAPASADQEDFTAYKVLYSALDQEPEGSLSFSFKSKVLRQINLKKARANDTKLYVIAGTVVLIGLIFMVFLAFYYSSIYLKYADIILKMAVLIGSALIALAVFYLFEEKYLRLEK